MKGHCRVCRVGYIFDEPTDMALARCPKCGEPLATPPRKWRGPVRRVRYALRPIKGAPQGFSKVDI